MYRTKIAVGSLVAIGFLAWKYHCSCCSTEQSSNELKERSDPKYALHPQLQAKLDEYRRKRNFNAEQWVIEKCSRFNQYMASNGLKAALVSVSGGIDSAVTLGLIKRSSMMDGTPLQRVLGIAQPIKSSAWALNRSRELSDALKSELVVIDQTKLHYQLSNLVDKQLGIKGGQFAGGQLRSYMRTPVGYYAAQLITQSGLPCVVMGTGNKDEDGYLAYFCKAGDGCVDIQLIADLHKSEVFKVGEVLGIPASILNAPPSADLWSGQTDEDELGFSYDFIELYTGGFLPLSNAEKEVFLSSLDGDAAAQFNNWRRAAERIHNRNKHKLSSPHNINILE